MKTVLIYDQCGQAPLEFYVLEGDYSHLDKIYINHINHDAKLMDELCDLLYDAETGASLLVPELNFPVNAVSKDTKVIIAGFLP